MSENRNDTTGYKKVNDLQAYVYELEKAGAKIVTAEKTARIAARRGEPGEQVISWSIDAKGLPIIEKEAEVTIDAETGNPGWVATKVTEEGEELIDRNGKKNQWIIGDQTFQVKYEADPMRLGIYRPVGGPQKFIKVNEAVHVMQRGDRWNVEAGGYINITKSEDMYMISGRDFEDTYRIL